MMGVRTCVCVGGSRLKTPTRAMVASSEQMTILCLASYHKGFEFLREAKRQGARVLLVTSASLKDAEWPRNSLDDVFYLPDDRKRWKLEELILGVTHLTRSV